MCYVNVLCNMSYSCKLNVHPRGYDPSQPADVPLPRAAESAAYVRRRRHSLTHLRPRGLGRWDEGVKVTAQVG